MNIKKYFKLYKAGKRWCTAAIATLAIVGGLIVGGVTVHADQQSFDLSLNQSVGNYEQLAATSQSTDQGNYGYLDSATVNNNNLQVSGWQATNQAVGKPFRYVVAYDQTNNRVLGQAAITENLARPDVARAYPRVNNADQSGYNTTIQNIDWGKVNSINDRIKIIAQYSNNAQYGQGQQVNYDSNQPVQLDRGNYANLDQFVIANNRLNIAGWHATNQALGRTHHFVILYDQTTNRELTRQSVGNARPDVAKVYPQVINADQSGFDTSFDLSNVDLNHELRVISRYSNTANGEGQYIDYWFNPKNFSPVNKSNQGYLDRFDISTAGQVAVSGWHATDYSLVEPNHFIILFDNTTNSQVASAKVTTIARPDVAQAFRNVQTAGHSGFDYTFKGVNLLPGHHYSLVSRYSTSDQGNGDNNGSKFTDEWLNGPTLNQAAHWVDSLTAIKGGLHVSGWMISDAVADKPNAYIILLNNGHEVSRALVQLKARPDVAAAYRNVYGSAKSGIDTNLVINPADLSDGNLQLIFRFAGTNANVDYQDQYSSNYCNNAGSWDQIRVNPTTISLSGWHATALAVNRPYQYIIVLDSNGHELYRQEVTKNLARPDVQAVYPWLIDSGNSGFLLSIPYLTQLRGQTIRFIHRYTDDPAGNGHYIDFYSAPIVMDLQYDMNANAINRYIKTHLIDHVNVTIDHVIPAVTGAYSRTSNGKPDMVVIHETADPNVNIWNEINNERHNYNHAFVHAFVDGSHIIEISTTDHEAWGAAYPANGHAIQFEQVEVNSANDFVHELVNGAYYAALKMHQYGIFPQLETKGHGTLWSHHEVSQFMGGTDHVDPDGYWTNRARIYFGTNYTMNDYFELVKYEYAHL